MGLAVEEMWGRSLRLNTELGVVEAHVGRPRACRPPQPCVLSLQRQVSVRCGPAEMEVPTETSGGLCIPVPAGFDEAPVRWAGSVRRGSLCTQALTTLVLPRRPSEGRVGLSGCSESRGEGPVPVACWTDSLGGRIPGVRGELGTH